MTALLLSRGTHSEQDIPENDTPFSAAVPRWQSCDLLLVCCEVDSIRVLASRPIMLAWFGVTPDCLAESPAVAH